MATQVGAYTILNKAQINPATGAVTIVLRIIGTNDGTVVADNIPTGLAATIRANLLAVSGQYDVIGV